MYAAIRRYVDNTDLADQLATRESDVRQVISSIEGFQAYYLVRADESTVSISVFDDAAGAEESSRKASAWMQENMPEVAAEAPRISVGEVLIAERR